MLIQWNDLQQKTTDIFVKAGAPEEDAALVAKELVRANMAGVDSHGVLRVPQYLEEMKAGSIVPGNAAIVMKETRNTAIVDCRHNFGQVGATYLTDLVVRKANKTGIACAITIHANHIGRLGSYVERAARQGLLTFATAAVYTIGPMAPFGASEGRLGTNPIAWAAPRSNGRPLMFDGATTVVAEGKLRAYIQQGKDVPAGWIRDGYGKDTVKPLEFYGPPRGTILPMGGAKGSALAMMADIFTVALANDDYWTCCDRGEMPDAQNGLYMMAVDPEMFFGAEAFEKQCEAHCRFFKGARPADGFSGVLLPGELEQCQEEKSERDGIELADNTWFGLIEIAKEYGCEWAQPLSTGKSAPTFVKM